VGHAFEAMTPLARPDASAPQTAGGNVIVPLVALHPSIGSMGSGAMHDVAVQTPSLPAGITTAKLVALPCAAVQVARSTLTVEPDALHVATSKQAGGCTGSHSGRGSDLRSLLRQTPARQVCPVGQVDATRPGVTSLAVPTQSQLSETRKTR
jgi:hypothetical protein